MMRNCTFQICLILSGKKKGKEKNLTGLQKPSTYIPEAKANKTCMKENRATEDWCFSAPQNKNTSLLLAQKGKMH